MNSARSRPAPQHSGPAEGAVAEFEALYRANVAAVTAYFARRSAEPHTVADLTADTFVAAITSFATFDPRKGTARAWVFGIARRIYAAHCQEHGQQRSRVERRDHHRSRPHLREPPCPAGRRLPGFRRCDPARLSRASTTRCSATAHRNRGGGPARPWPPPRPRAAACACDVEGKESVKATAGWEAQALQRS
jgi:hypothetical protein